MSHVGEDNITYSRFFELCSKAYERHGDILGLPAGIHPYEYLKRAYHNDYPGGKVLDFGCGADMPLKHAIGLADTQYFACDNDEGATFHYHEVYNIPTEEMFDIISACHVLEHIPFQGALNVVKALASHVKEGGIMMIIVPNPMHPTRYLASNPLHITPLNYLNICAMLELAGLDPYMCARTHKHRAPLFFERPIINWLCKRFMMDWCDGIYAVGRRRSL